MILLSVLFIPSSFPWQITCFAAVAGCGYEWARLAHLSRLISLGYSVATSVVCVYFANTATLPLLLLATAFWLFASPACLYRPRLLATRTALLPLGIVLIPAAGLSLIELREQGAAVLLGILAIVWLSDSVAYFAGRRYGRRKLAPSISPGKSWEGAIAGLLAVFLYAAYVSHAFPRALPAWIQVSGAPAALAILLALVLGITGIIGDLVESALKRNAGVKDSGRVFPGHGGVLDRADALLAALPVAALLYQVR